MKPRISPRSKRLLFIFCVIHIPILRADASAQERLELSATAEQGAVATYSEPIDISKHSLLAAGRAALDLSTFRLPGTVQNLGGEPVRLTVFAIPDGAHRESVSRHPDGYFQERFSRHPDGYYLEVFSRHPDGYYLERERRTGQRPPADAPPRFAEIFRVDIDARGSIDLASHAPQDPSALERMMSEGPVRFGISAPTLTRGSSVGVAVSTGSSVPARGPGPERNASPRPSAEAARSLHPYVNPGHGAVSLVDGDTDRSGPFFRGEPVFPAAVPSDGS
jgi:hypothetical protein